MGQKTRRKRIVFIEIGFANESFRILLDKVFSTGFPAEWVLTREIVQWRELLQIGLMGFRPDGLECSRSPFSRG